MNEIKKIVLGEQNIETIQNSKGLWNFKISIYCNSVMDGLEVMDAAMGKAMKIRKKHNEAIREEEKKDNKKLEKEK